MGRKTFCASGIAVVSLLLGLLVSCGGDKPEAEIAAGTKAAPAALPRNEAAPGATVFFVSPLNGATVASPVAVKFGISGIAIQPAGVMSANSGHHHLLVDTELADPNLPVPSDPQHLHFGKGQTETTLELEPGEHTLQLVLGDSNHIPHITPVISEPITITVE